MNNIQFLIRQGNTKWRTIFGRQQWSKLYLFLPFFSTLVFAGCVKWWQSDWTPSVPGQPLDKLQVPTRDSEMNGIAASKNDKTRKRMLLGMNWQCAKCLLVHDRKLTPFHCSWRCRTALWHWRCQSRINSMQPCIYQALMPHEMHQITNHRQYKH